MTEELEGEVSVEVTAAGSKGERRSVVLRRPGEETAVVLRSRRPASLSAEPALAAYAGRRVRVRGEPGWASFVVDEIEELDAADPITDRAEEPPAGR